MLALYSDESRSSEASIEGSGLCALGHIALRIQSWGGASVEGLRLEFPVLSYYSSRMPQ